MNRDRILQEALDLVDQEGLEALTMRALGARLGVAGMALYHHLPSKDQLLDGLMEVLLGAVEIPEEGPWKTRLRRAAESYRRVALTHPKAFLLVLTRPYQTATLLRFCDRLLQIFLEAGFAPAEATRAFRLLGHFLDGATLYISQGPASSFAPPPAPVDPEHFPALAACRPHLARAHAEGHFQVGLDRLLADLERQLRESRTAKG